MIDPNKKVGKNDKTSVPFNKWHMKYEEGEGYIKLAPLGKRRSLGLGLWSSNPSANEWKLSTE